MLKVNVPSVELFNEKENRFEYTKPVTFTIEHSLVSISKWESKWCKSFIFTQNKTGEELIDYVRCMTLTQNVDPNVYYLIPETEFEKIRAYMDAPMTATTFTELEETQNPVPRKITSEEIYYWMIALNIPFECQKWHLNRLLTLIRVCAIKNAPQKKMSDAEIRAQHRAVNSKRRAQARARRR